MASSKIVCAIVIVVFACAQIASGLDCLFCGGTLDSIDKAVEACKNNTTTTCGAGADRCLTIHSDKGVIWRSCGTQAFCDLFSDCDACKENKCNSSPSLLPSLATFGFVTLLIAKYFS